MRISIANVSENIEDGEFKTVVHAIERQVHEDFFPLWGLDAEIRLSAIDRDAQPAPDLNLADVVIYVGETTDDTAGVDGAIGYHFRNHTGIAYGFVFADIAKQLGEHWSTTLSHEVLELIADPEANLLVLTQHPQKPKQLILRPYEVCDPVQGDTYPIDGVTVANFVTPLYFAELDHPVRTQTNYLNLELPRFGVRENGYYSYFDLKAQKYIDIYGAKVDAKQRSVIKEKLGQTRRQARRVNATETGHVGPPQGPHTRGQKLLGRLKKRKS